MPSLGVTSYGQQSSAGFNPYGGGVVGRGAAGGGSRSGGVVGPTGAGGGGNNADLIKRAIDQMNATTQPQVQSAPINNTAAPNPVSNGAIDWMTKRAQGDMGAGAALDKGIQDIRARASLGIGRENEVRQAQNGTTNSSIVGSDAQELARAQGADVNRLTTDITLGRERDRDALMGNVASIGLGQGAQQQAQQRIAQDQYQFSATQALENRRAQMQNFSTILSLLGGGNSVL